MSSHLFVADRQHVAQPQARGVREDHVGGQQDPQRAVERMAGQRFRRGNQVLYLTMSPGTDLRKNGLDPTNGACTFVSQQAVVDRCFPQRIQHSAVVVDSGAREFLEGGGEVGIYPRDRKVMNIPVQSLGEDAHLLCVSGTTPHADNVLSGECLQRHEENKLMGGNIPTDGGNKNSLAKSPEALNSGRAPLAQLDSEVAPPPLLAGGWPIIRIVYTTLLATLVFFRFTGSALTCLVLGQFLQIAIEYRRELRRIRAPRRGPS